MRSLPFSSTLGTGLAKLITIRRGTSAIRFTTHNETLTDSNGDTYAPGEGASVSDITFSSDCSPATCDIKVFARNGGTITPGDAARGVLDGWPVSVQLIDIGNTGAGSFDLITAATTGHVTENGDGVVTIPVNGPLLQARGPTTEHYDLICRANLGDDKCKVPILPAEVQRSTAYVTVNTAGGLQAVNDCYVRVATGAAGTVNDYANVYYECTTAGTTASTAPTYDPTVGNTTTDGTAVFTARNAWLRYAYGSRSGDYTILLTALPDSRASDDAWYVMGGVYIRSGPLAGFPPIPIRAWDHSTLTLTTALPIGSNDIPSNTQMEIYPGCRLLWDTDCFNRFNNTVNRRSEIFVPPSNSFGGF